MTIRAMLFHGAGRPFEERQVEIQPPRPGEVIVRIDCCTICSSDLHTHAGRRMEPTPLVLGHEVVGRIAALGDADSSLKVGDRITWSVAASCGSCPRCAMGIPQKCESLIKYGHREAVSDATLTGGLAEYIVLAPGTGIVRVPESVSDGLAAMASCATATVAAVLRSAGTLAGRSVHIVGAGVLGLTACAWARALGAARVSVSDPDELRMVRAAAFGASESNSPADVVLEFAGTAPAVEQAIASAGIGGTIVLAGTVRPVGTVPLDPERLVRSLLTLRGVHNYRSDDLVAAVDFLTGPGRDYPFESLIGRSFPLAETDAAFAHAHAHPGERVRVIPEDRAS